MVCEHSIVMKDMCAQCGADLRVKHGVAGQRKEVAAARVSMIHHVPELHVSNDLAKQLGDKDRTNVLTQKKLVLLVDLDQTIIHTTNQTYEGPYNPDDIYRYAIQTNRYFTKKRPHCHEFLEKMSKLYEMHVVTFGQRLYAHKITQWLDPDKRFFGERIMSRDELFHNFQKTQNLKALFPCGEELIAIIDDRRDVWEDMENLVQVKPYKFFRDVGDINAPAAKRFVAAEKAAKGEQQPSTSDNSDANGNGAPRDDKDADNTLLYVEQVLTEAHRRFYAHYEATNEVLDMKNVIADIRREVLCGVCIVLSGIVPQGEDPPKSNVYQLLIRFGADIQEQVTQDTTVVIGGRWGTTKIHQAHRANIPVVSIKWLDTVCEQWKKPPFEDFILSKDTVNDKPHRIHPHMRTGSLAQMETLKKEELKSMADEVDEALSDEDDDEEEEEEGEDENENVNAEKKTQDKEEDVEDEEEVPLGTMEESVEDDTDKYSEEDSRSTDDDDFAEPARKRRRKMREDDEDEENPDFDDLDESGDFGNDGNDDDEDDEDDELAADLEQQFFA